MNKIKLLFLVVLMYYSTCLIYPQEIMRIEVSSATAHFIGYTKTQHYPPLDFNDSLHLEYLREISSINSEFAEQYQLQYQLYKNFLETYNGKEIKCFRHKSGNQNHNLKDPHIKELWQDFSRSRYYSSTIEDITPERAVEFENWLKNNNPFYVNKINESFPVLSFRFIPNRQAVYIIDSLYIKTIAYLVCEGGLEADRIRHIEIEVSTTSGDIVKKGFERSINIEEEKYINIRFITPRQISQPLYRQIGDVLIQTKFAYYADGKRNYFELDPFWLNIGK